MSFAKREFITREFVIEHDVPCPERGEVRTPASKAAEKMKIGDSILFTTECEMRTARATVMRLGGKVASRKQEGGWRLWRIE